MAKGPATRLLDDLRRPGLLEPDQLRELTESLQQAFPDPTALARKLLQLRWLTAYQTKALLQGRGRSLLLGPYVLLEQIGEGGMGQVFKARHAKLGRIVALKLIRAERLSNPQTVGRFRREIRAAAQLSHPNIVHAYDADEAGGVHFFAMEYVEGTDLAKLLKQHGPLPVAGACEYIRQAALGLQHAHEKGLVHRDLKPHNLLLTKDGVVKVLDLGLARLGETVVEQSGEFNTATGIVMGTPDYMAPEQANDAKRADIRADLYSLGCTLYHLLTGCVPFPGQSLTEKLLGHQMQQPRPIEELRPDVPPAVAAVVRRLMAKKPADRYQTPAEAAAALAAAPDETTSAPALYPARGDTALAETADLWSTIAATPPVEPPAAPADRRRWLMLSAVGGALLLVLAGVLALVLRTMTAPAPGPGPTVAERTPPTFASPAASFEQWLKSVVAMSAEKQVEEVRAKLKERNPRFDGQLTSDIANGQVLQLSFATENVSDISPVRALPHLKSLSCAAVQAEHGALADLSPLTGMALTSLNVNGNLGVHDLSPLRGLPLEWLNIGFTTVDDLSPLRSVPLASLTLHNCSVRELSGLRGVRLKELRFGGWSSQISDLSPLEGMPLQTLYFQQTQVRDLAPLRTLPLRDFRYGLQVVSDLSPLKDAPLETFEGDFNAWRDADVLRGIKTLKTINNQPAEKVWEKVDADRAMFDRWATKVAAMPPGEQVPAIAAKLKEFNPEFDGKLEHEVQNGAVARLVFSTDGVTDLSPVRALTGLRELSCGGTAEARRGKLADLSPLRGMKLTVLSCNDTQVDQLGPLAGMPLERLDIARTQVRELKALKDAPLERLVLDETPITDLTPLKRMPSLRKISLRRTEVGDLSPLSVLALTSLDWTGSPIADVSPLQSLPLIEVACDYRPWRDGEVLRAVKTVKRINGQPTAAFWEKATTDAQAFEEWRRMVAGLAPQDQVEAVRKKLIELNPGFDESFVPTIVRGTVKELDFTTDNVTDLSPVRALPELEQLTCKGSAAGKGKVYDLSPLRGTHLQDLDCSNNAVRDLSSLKGLPLRHLAFAATQVADLTSLTGMPLAKVTCSETRVADLSPLTDAPLTALDCQRTRVADLSPLRGKQLQSLDCTATRVADLSPLRGVPLRELHCARTGVDDLSPLPGLPLKELTCNFWAERDAGVLRGIKTLQKINGKSAAAFWKEAERWTALVK
jgi:Leucine-rich repeat (LRR) protein/tRNA A-37 threonylcarbamoyl transferase component Bud32